MTSLVGNLYRVNHLTIYQSQAKSCQKMRQAAKNKCNRAR